MLKSDVSSTPSEDLHLRNYLRRWLHTLIALDGPMWGTFRQLMSCPGKLAVEQLESNKEPEPLGTRRRGVHPVRLYLTINVIFFLLAPWVNGSKMSVWQTQHWAVLEMQPAFVPVLNQAIAASKLDDGLFRLLLDLRMTGQQGAWVWMLIPCLALASFVFVRRRRPYAVEHLVLATNLISFFLVATLTLGLSGRCLAWWLPPGGDMPVIVIGVILAWFLAVAWTFTRSVKVFFDLNLWRSILLAGWLGTAFSFGFWIYMQVLFLASLLRMQGIQPPGS